MSLGDFATGVTIDTKFTTIDDTGAPTTLSGTPAVSVYKDNSTTQSTSGVTLSVDFDSVTGLNNVRVDTSSDGTFYSAGSSFQLVITTGTVDGVSVVGYVIDAFTLARDASFARLGAPAGASVSADIAAVKVDTAAILVDTGTTLDGRIPAALVGGRMDANVGAISSDATAADNAEAFFDGTGYAGTNNVIPTVTTVNGLAANVITAAATAADFLAEVNAEVDTAFADYDPPTKAELDAAVANVSVDEIQATALADLFNTDSGTTYASAVAGSVVAEIADNAGGSALTAAAIADAVWDEAQADHVGAGTFGITASELADVLVDTAEIGAAGAGLTNINLPNQTMDIVGNITGNLSGSVGSVTGAVGSVTGAVGSVTGNVGGNVTGSVGSLAAQAKADVNAEVLDVLNTDTFAEPGQGAPAATNTLVNKLSFLYKAWRNRSTQTASEYALYADDATTKDQEAAVSDDATTLDRGEVGTGA